MSNLQSIFHSLGSRYSSTQNLINSLWQEIEKQYSGSKRHYHNLSHLEYMVEKAEQFKSQIEDYDTLLFAIFYHDIIYKATRKDNELKSAQLAQKRMTELGVPAEKIKKCFQQIVATQHHEPTEDKDTRYLLDIDMAILGEDAATYNNYTKKVRKEYSIYPDLLYKPGRKKALQNFLKQDRIFQTEAFFKNLEKQARDNIQNEIAKLGG